MSDGGVRGRNEEGEQQEQPESVGMCAYFQLLLGKYKFTLCGVWHAPSQHNFCCKAKSPALFHNSSSSLSLSPALPARNSIVHKSNVALKLHIASTLLGTCAQINETMYTKAYLRSANGREWRIYRGRRRTKKQGRVVENT